MSSPDILVSNLEAMQSVELPRYTRANGEVVVAEVAAQVPFAISRVFSVTAHVGAQRGRHAHRRCSQFMLCVSGAVEVVCEDGRDRRRFELNRNHIALLVPPMIWNTVIFRQVNSVLLVLCDRPYEEQDYIRDYHEFLTFCGVARI